MSSSTESSFAKTFVEFEQHVAKLFHREGWEVETPKSNQPGYDLVVRKDGIVAAVQVKWLRANVAAPMLQRFAAFLESEDGREFNRGYFITTKGYGGPALA